MPVFDAAFQHDLATAGRAGRLEVPPEALAVYGRALHLMNDLGVPYAVGAAFALAEHAGIARPTKDLDLFVTADDLHAILEAFRAAGFATEVTVEHWLAKAACGAHVVDCIFGMGHGRLQVDESWLARALPAEFAGVPTRQLAVEELIVSKLSIAERHRFDGADIAHLILRQRGQIDWARVLALLGDQEALLLPHLLLFDYIYPGQSACLPRALMRRLFEQVSARWAQPADPRTFRGTLLDPFSFLVDVEAWGYRDPRHLTPLVDATGARLPITRLTERPPQRKLARPRAVPPSRHRAG